MIREAAFILFGVVAILLLTTAGNPVPLLIEDVSVAAVPAHLCLPPSPPLLGPREGEAVFPAKRKESEA